MKLDIVQGISGYLNAYAYETIAVTNTATVALTASKVTPTTSDLDRKTGRAKLVKITVEGGAVRYSTVSGVPPVTAGGNGHLLAVGDELPLINYNEMKNVLFIADTATAGSLRVTYYR